MSGEEDSLNAWIEHNALGPHMPTAEHSLETALSECNAWRVLWGYTPKEVQYYLARMGLLVRLVGRNYIGRVGILTGMEFEPKHIEVKLAERQFDVGQNVYYYENKTLQMPVSGLAWFEIIHDREVEDNNTDALTGEPIGIPSTF